MGDNDNVHQVNTLRAIELMERSPLVRLAKELQEKADAKGDDSSRCTEDPH